MIIKKHFVVTLVLLAVVLPALFLTAYSYSKPSITWDMINVNYGKMPGDAHLLRVGDKNILIDAGYFAEAKKALVPFLQKNNIETIDYFFISHPHRDHYEGALAVIQAGIPIKRLLYKEPARDVSDCCYSRSHFVWFMNKIVNSGTSVAQPKTGYKLALPHNASIEIMHAQEGNLPNQAVDVNDLSLVMKWKVYGKSVLFTGDLNKAVGSYLSTDLRLKSDILKIPHHGGYGIAPNSFYATVSPSAAMIPGPKWIFCGKRGKQTRQWLDEQKIPTWVNGLDGNIKITFTPFDVIFDPAKPSSECHEENVPTKLNLPVQFSLTAEIRSLLKSLF